LGLLKPTGDERRTSRRRTLEEVPEIIEIKTDSATVTVVDISSGGLCLVSSERLTPGHGIRVHIVSEEQTETIRLRILRCQLKSQDGKLVYEAAGMFDKPLTIVADEEPAANAPKQIAQAAHASENQAANTKDCWW
jgi:hypothetical protein